MHDKLLLLKEIDTLSSIYQQEETLYLPSIQNISSLTHAENLKQLIQQDIGCSTLVNKFIQLTLSLTPFVRVISLVNKVLKSLQIHKKDSTSNRQTKDQILSDIEDIIQEHAEEDLFVDLLRNYLIDKDYNMSQLAREAGVDYTYLNKLLNKKLSPNSIISKDYILKIALTLKLTLQETNELLASCGYIIYGRSTRDMLLIVCIDKQVGLALTNELLFEKGYKTL